jgi:hypothetical protein
VQHARGKLLAATGIREVLAWQGVWNWTFVYERDQQRNPAVAYIVPDPSRPRICVTIPEAMLADLSLPRLSKSVRDGIVFAPVVNAIRWPTWDIHSKPQVDELLELLFHRLPHEQQGVLAGS